MLCPHGNIDGTDARAHRLLITRLQLGKPMDGLKEVLLSHKTFQFWIVVGVLSYGAKLPPSPAGRWARGSFAPEPARWTAEPVSRTGHRGRVHRPDSAGLSQGMHTLPLTLQPLLPGRAPSLPLGAIPLAAGYLALSSSQGYTSATLNAARNPVLVVSGEVACGPPSGTAGSPRYLVARGSEMRRDHSGRGAGRFKCMVISLDARDAPY
ncbi:hypothetical protein BN2476_740090 [Paraburkholderia piptadeniae]|uniref:Uncharacterized protein n=1 Tax=Paraburkholderia piptadeniae TaxID=1701573 RepID=A0A1N7SSX0_9BURK|nr:hypothetical protein BN2476_740090 [Paraburkholderia piptadeniae]